MMGRQQAAKVFHLLQHLLTHFRPFTPAQHADRGPGPRAKRKGREVAPAGEHPDGDIDCP
jgi:hypothetical protein